MKITLLLLIGIAFVSTQAMNNPNPNPNESTARDDGAARSETELRSIILQEKENLKKLIAIQKTLEDELDIKQIKYSWERVSKLLSEL